MRTAVLLCCLCAGLAGEASAQNAPSLKVGGVVNAADYTANFAPGSIMSLWGTDFASTSAKASQVPLPTILDGVSVEIVDGERILVAPMFFVSPGQINALLPYEIAGSSARVRVRNSRGTSNAEQIAVASRAPGLFTKSMDGKGEAIVTHADFKMVGTDNPAFPDEVVLVFLTGLGKVEPQVESGRSAGDNGSNGPLNLVKDAVTVYVGGQQATVQFAGLAPLFVGLYQLNIRLPARLPGGAQPIVVECGGGRSLPGVTIEIRRQIQVDGDPSDWLGLSPTGYDDRGDSAAGPSGDLIHFYSYAAPTTTYFLWEMNGPITDSSLEFQLLIDKAWDGLGWLPQDAVLQTQLGSCPKSPAQAGWSCAFAGRYLEMAVDQTLLPPFLRVRVRPLVRRAPAALDQLSCHSDVYVSGMLRRSDAEIQDLRTRAERVHSAGWQSLLADARTDPYSRYALYSSRILAVKHPEVYLLADIAFLDDIKAHPLRPYVLTPGAVSAFPAVSPDALFPSNFPFLPYLDRRAMGPVSTLKNVRNRMLAIDRAILMYYLQRPLHKLGELYIVYCDSGQSFVHAPEGLLDVVSGERVPRPSGNPVLIFNESAAWYPLLERDDTATAPSLAAVVASYKTSSQSPQLTKEESSFIDGLRQLTSLSSPAQIAVAVLVASKGFRLPSVRSMVSKANASQALEGGQMELALTRDARISPVAAHLVAVAQRYDSPRKWLEMSAEMAELVNVRCRPPDDDPNHEFSDGFFDPWDFEHPATNVPMARLNLNERYYSLAGGDDVPSYAVAEILGMLGYHPYILSSGWPRITSQIPSSGGPHLVLPAEGIKFESSDFAAAIIWDNWLLWSGASVAERSLDFFYSDGQFAAVIPGQYQGTMSPVRAAEIATYLRQVFRDDFTYITWNGSKYQSITHDEFLKAMAEEQKRWVPTRPLP